MTIAQIIAIAAPLPVDNRRSLSSVLSLLNDQFGQDRKSNSGDNNLVCSSNSKFESSAVTVALNIFLLHVLYA